MNRCSCCERQLKNVFMQLKSMRFLTEIGWTNNEVTYCIETFYENEDGRQFIVSEYSPTLKCAHVIK